MSTHVPCPHHPLQSLETEPGKQASVKREASTHQNTLGFPSVTWPGLRVAREHWSSSRTWLGEDQSLLLKQKRNESNPRHHCKCSDALASHLIQKPKEGSTAGKQMSRHSGAPNPCHQHRAHSPAGISYHSKQKVPSCNLA